tara:strand:- start:614 stop:766 length:153 start_codon:yes stop_codon:yes gene_type:complete
LERDKEEGASGSVSPCSSPTLLNVVPMAHCDRIVLYCLLHFSSVEEEYDL